MIIPDKHLFIVTSALKPAVGAFNDDQRFHQTIETLKSIRQKVPDAIILLADASVRPWSELERTAITEKTNFFMDLSEEPTMKSLSERGMKSQAENVMLHIVLNTLKNTPQLGPMMSVVKCIHKFSARSVLEDTFDTTKYDNTFGKFVFLKHIPTWMNPPRVPALFITRFYSFCPSLIDIYLDVIQKNLQLIDQGLDTEHSHYNNIPANYLIEFDKVDCWGWLAGNGTIEHY